MGIALSVFQKVLSIFGNIISHGKSNRDQIYVRVFVIILIGAKLNIDAAISVHTKLPSSKVHYKFGRHFSLFRFKGRKRPLQCAEVKIKEKCE